MPCSTRAQTSCTVLGTSAVSHIRKKCVDVHRVPVHTWNTQTPHHRVQKKLQKKPARRRHTHAALKAKTSTPTRKNVCWSIAYLSYGIRVALGVRAQSLPGFSDIIKIDRAPLARSAKAAVVSQLQIESKQATGQTISILRRSGCTFYWYVVHRHR